MVLVNEQLSLAIEDNADIVWKAFFDSHPDGWFEKRGNLRAMYSGLPYGMFNGFAAAGPLNDSEIDQAIGEMNATGAPWYWQVGPNSPDGMKERLTERGLEHRYDLPGMAVPLTDWHPAGVPEELEIRKAGGTEIYKDFCTVATGAFGMSEAVTDFFMIVQSKLGYAEDCLIQNFVGYAEGKPAVTGAVAYGAGVAGIYTIGTLEEFRGRGYGAAITEACMYDAKQRGESVAILHASQMGYPVYRKLGFKDVCALSFYAFPQ